MSAHGSGRCAAHGPVALFARIQLGRFLLHINGEQAGCSVGSETSRILLNAGSCTVLTFDSVGVVGSDGQNFLFIDRNTNLIRRPATRSKFINNRQHRQSPSGVQGNSSSYVSVGLTVGHGDHPPTVSDQPHLRGAIRPPFGSPQHYAASGPAIRRRYCIDTAFHGTWIGQNTSISIG